MRRSWPSRLLAGLLALWLAMRIAEPGLLHACPMHDGTQAGSRGAHAVTPPEHHRHGAPRESHPPASRACQCVDACSPAVAVVVPAALRIADVPLLAVRDPGLPEHEYVPVERSHRLPFANGPPLA